MPGTGRCPPPINHSICARLLIAFLPHGAGEGSLQYGAALLDEEGRKGKDEFALELTNA